MDRPDVPRAAAAVPSSAAARPARRRSWLPWLADATGERSTAQTALLIVSFAALLISWTLMWKILLETPVIDVTGIEPTLVIGGLLLPLAAPWRLVKRMDRPVIALLGVLFAWFLLTALTRASGEEVKRALSYAAFTGLSFALAFVAVRLDPRRAARWLVVFFVGALLLALGGAVLERLTYPGWEEPDPLAGFWSLFRRSESFLDPRLGVLAPTPLHYPLGEGGSFRTAGVFAHPVYLGFFALLATALMTALTLRSWHTGARRVGLLYVAGIACGTLVSYWTYSRSPLAALVLVVPFTALIDWADRGPLFRRPALADAVPAALVVSTVVLVLGVSVATDQAGLRRLQGALPGAAQADVIDDTSVEGSAARSASRRFASQRVAIEMITESPRALLLGPGMTAYEVEMLEGPNRDSPDPVFHPHNPWLTMTLAAGLPGAGLFTLLLVVVWLGLVRALRRERDGLRRAMLVWLAAWLPVWSAAQVFGLNPLFAQEAVVLGSMLGFASAFSNVSRSGDGAAGGSGAETALR